MVRQFRRMADSPLFAERVNAWIGAKCRELGCIAIATAAMPDHVHLLVELQPTVSVAELVRQVMGASSYAVSHVPGAAAAFRWQTGATVISLDAQRSARSLRARRRTPLPGAGVQRCDGRRRPVTVLSASDGTMCRS
jgi:REP element-mobilizing transposase RayT